MVLLQFLEKNESQILALAEQKILDLAQDRPSSSHLREGLPLFYAQLLKVLRLGQIATIAPEENPKEMAAAASDSNEPAMAHATNRPKKNLLK